jgi:glucose-6-phosphate-specific signal transduction histidine kinase
VAAYYVVAEALANAAKHAQASRLTVAARKAREHLQIEVPPSTGTHPTRRMTTELGERT